MGAARGGGQGGRRAPNGYFSLIFAYLMLQQVFKVRMDVLSILFTENTETPGPMQVTGEGAPAGEGGAGGRRGRLWERGRRGERGRRREKGAPVGEGRRREKGAPVGEGRLWERGAGGLGRRWREKGAPAGEGGADTGAQVYQKHACVYGCVLSHNARGSTCRPI